VSAPRQCIQCGGTGKWGEVECEACRGTGSYVKRRQRTVRGLYTILLTAAELTAIRTATGNSVADPDWWNSHGRGQRAAFGRGMAKLEQQPVAREPVHPHTPKVKRCGVWSDQGLRCGMAKGHKGDHNALAWTVTPPPMSLEEMNRG
jgi:hypothetical protein